MVECKNSKEKREHVDDFVGKELFNVGKNFLKELLDFRKKSTEMCNMILVLLVVSLMLSQMIYSINVEKSKIISFLFL